MVGILIDTDIGSPIRPFIRPESEPKDKTDWPSHECHDEYNKTSRLATSFRIDIRPREAPEVESTKNEEQD